MTTFNVCFPGNKKVNVSFENHEIKTDQSLKNGGDETAPEPFAVFLSSLAACAGIYAKSFFDARSLATDGMHLSLEVTAGKTGQTHLEQIHITLYVNALFPKKYVKPVIKAMEQCAVKNQLHPDIKTRTEVVVMEPA
jgi:ribosomal protein S12 methylthiotransferase accessory factor